MDFVKYDSRPANWEELISGFDTKTLFHETPWHDHILDIHPPSKILYFSIQDKGKIIGYFCGQMIRKFIFNIMGSPLGGTGTNYMGPIVNMDISQPDLIAALNRMCRKEKIHHIELCNDIFQADVMTEAGFIKIDRVTHMLSLEGDEDALFVSFKSNCRNRIRKGMKNKLIVEVAQDNSIADHFFEQFKEVYGKQGMVIPFGKDRVVSLFNSLNSYKKLLPLVVRQGDDVLATGLFPYDNNAIYFWGATSWLKFQKLCPNELLHWEVVKFAISKNIPFYNMCGGGSRFKNKFGGEDVSFPLFTKSYMPVLKYARTAYKKFHFFQLKAKNFISKNNYTRKKRIG